MKRSTTVSLLAVALLAIAPANHASQHENGKTTAKEVRQEVTDAAEAIKQYTADKRDEAAREAQAALAELDARIEALERRVERKWNRMDQAAREQASTTLKALRKQRIEVAEWYGGLKNSSAEAWEHMKSGFSGAYRSLRRAWEKAEKEYQEDGRQ